MIINKKEHLKFILFDIKGVYEEDSEVEKANKILLESPVRILNQYTSEMFFPDLSKNTDEEFSEIMYSFSFPISENNLQFINCLVIDNYSFGHTNTNYADGYIIFFNLDNFNRKELEKLIDYIIDECSREVKIYVIGIYKNKVSITNKEITIFLDSFNIEYEYYEMYGGTNFKEIKNEYPDSININDLFEKIFNDTYQQKAEACSKIERIKNIKKDEKLDGSGCLLY